MARRRSYRERSRNYELAISARHPPLSASMRSSRPVTVEVLAREVAAARFRPFQSPPLEVVLPPVDQRFEDGDPRVVLAVGRYQVPVRVRIIGHRDHVLQGVQVGTALLSVAPVIGGEFPLYQGIALAVLEALQLYLVRDVQPELHERDVVVNEHALEVHDLLAGTLRGSMLAVKRRIAPPLPAASKPSKRTTRPGATTSG